MTTSTVFLKNIAYKFENLYSFNWHVAITQLTFFNQINVKSLITPH